MKQQLHLDFKITISDRLALIAIVVAFFSLWYTYKTALYTREANIIADQQKEIAQQQTNILDNQTIIQNESLQFEKDKRNTEVNQKYNEDLGKLYDRIMDPNDIFSQIHKKIQNREKVINEDNLIRYVDAFENIGKLYCDGKIRYADLKFTLGKIVEKTCGNDQIFYKFQNTKSGISGMCKILFPSSSVMAKRADPTKCRALNQ